MVGCVRFSQGLLHFSVQLSPLSSPWASASASSALPSERSVELVRLLERSIRESRTVDVEALCIVPSEKVWSLRVDVTVLDDAGNLADAVSMAALAALVRYRRPDVSVSAESVALLSPDARQPVALHLHHVPLCATFALLDGGELWVADPTREEEQASDAALSVVVDDFHHLCGLYKMGGAPLPAHRLVQLVQQADAHVHALMDRVRGVEDGQPQQQQRPPQQRTAAGGAEDRKREAPAGGVEGAELFGAVVARSAAALSSDGPPRAERRRDPIDLGNGDGGGGTDDAEAAGDNQVGPNGNAHTTADMEEDKDEDDGRGSSGGHAPGAATSTAQAMELATPHPAPIAAKGRKR